MADFRNIVRIVNTDLDGNLKLFNALNRIKGVSFMFSNAVCNVLTLDRQVKLGDVEVDTIAKIEELIKNPNDKLPSWLLNRRKDYDTGADKHIVSASIALTKEFDIKRLKKIKSRRGLRHAARLPLRGQRTKTNARTRKGPRRLIK